MNSAISFNMHRARAAQDYFDALRADGLATVVEHPLRGDVFFDVSIESMRFQGLALQDPAIVDKDSGSGCQLGVASILEGWHYHEAAAAPAALSRGVVVLGEPRSAKRWMLTKYQPSEGRVDLSRLSSAGRRALAVTFGMRLGVRIGEAGFSDHEAFFISPAFVALVVWARAHPRVFKAIPDGANYLYGWKAFVEALHRKDD